MARKAITYRAARRNLVIRGAGLTWHPAVQFAPGGREYRPREARKGEHPQFYIKGTKGRVGMVLECVRAWAPAMHKDFLQALLFAARIAEQKERAA